MSQIKENVLTREPHNVTEETVANKLWKDMTIKTFPEVNDIHTAVVLGNRDQFITDSRSNDKSVLFVNDSYKIVISGVIYNMQSIKHALVEKGFTFYTTSDSEVLCALYAHKQEGLLEDLRGKFSFIIWDKQEQVLFGARDQFGIKPLYYMEHDNGMYFASEIKAFKPYIEPAEINVEALHHYFSFQYVPQPMTMYNDIHALEAGKYFYRRIASL